jgi:hypothetical protein
VQDHQEAVQIRVYQGDHRKAEHNALLGEFEFSGFQKGLRADVKIDVTFEIDADGIVNVTATDRATGEAASTRITLSSGLAEEQIERILDQDVAGRVAQTPHAPADSTSAVPPIEQETPENPAVLDAPTEEVEEPFGDAGALFDDGCPDLSLGQEEDGLEIDDLDTDGLDSIEDDELDALALEMDLDAGELEFDAPLAEDPELEQDFESEGLCLDPPTDGEARSNRISSRRTSCSIHRSMGRTTTSSTTRAWTCPSPRRIGRSPWTTRPRSTPSKSPRSPGSWTSSTTISCSV